MTLWLLHQLKFSVIHLMILAQRYIKIMLSIQLTLLLARLQLTMLRVVLLLPILMLTAELRLTLLLKILAHQLTLAL